jgi:hypothetical protein
MWSAFGLPLLDTLTSGLLDWKKGRNHKQGPQMKTEENFPA